VEEAAKLEAAAAGVRAEALATEARAAQERLLLTKQAETEMATVRHTARNKNKNSVSRACTVCQQRALSGKAWRGLNAT